MHCPSCRAENEPGNTSCAHCGQGLYALAPGAVLDQRYEILQPLGRGGMGMVYKAHDRELDEIVAVKVLRSDVAPTPDISRRFRSEIKLARRVRHRNVCGIHEFGQDGDLQYIAMEFVDGVDLRRVLRERGALPAGEALEVAIQLAEGLDAIHEEGIIHRDLKTPNVMRDRRGIVRLMDFGIAKQAGVESGGLMSIGHVLGTPEYMSPEQARGESVDSRSDIYALGIVVYELFTGAVPFHTDSPLATLLKHVNEPPPFDQAGIPEEVLPILRRALAKSRYERYPTAREMADSLRAAAVALAETGRDGVRVRPDGPAVRPPDEHGNPVPPTEPITLLPTVRRPPDDA
jgi:serine/threonine-protein kinase